MPGEEPISVFAPSLMREMFRSHLGGWDIGYHERRRIEALKRWEKTLLQMSLYADEIWLPSLGAPDGFRDTGRTLIAEREIGIAVHSEYRELIRNNYEGINSVFKRLKPLVDASVIRFYDPYRLYYDYVAEPLFGSRRPYTAEELKNAWPDRFVAEGLLYASAIGKPYTALSGDEEAVIGRAAKELVALPQLEGAIVSGLIKLDLPGFDADPQSLADARKDDEVFEEFRKTLRSIFRQMRETKKGEGFEKELEQLKKDVIVPKLDELDKQSKKTRSLGNFAKTGAITFSATALASLIVGPLAALGAASVSTVAQIMLKMMFDQPKAGPDARFFNRIRVSGSPSSAPNRPSA